MIVPIETGWPTRDTSRLDLHFYRHSNQREQCKDKQPQITCIPVESWLLTVSPLAWLSMVYVCALKQNCHFCPFFNIRSLRISKGDVPQSAGVKFWWCNVKVYIWCHGTFGNMQGHKLGDLVNRMLLEICVGQKNDMDICTADGERDTFRIAQNLTWEQLVRYHKKKKEANTHTGM